MKAASVPRQPDFLIQLRRTQHAVRMWLDSELEGTGLTTPQYTVLAALEREGNLSASDLAREFGMTPQTVNVLVKALEACGLLRRERHLDHGRILVLSLTGDGRRALKHGRQIALTIQGRILRSIESQDRVRLMAALQAVEQVSNHSLLNGQEGTPKRTGS
ncbi:MAG TPA: MarR family transcriptional regulator [Candidatus Dormibacteraeota bacterium]|nr:MarR family transcriptional regulator [Candidatus Dormibacteraeota bacterium]